MERRLTRELSALLPGSVVVGEEACAAAPQLLDLLNRPGLAWVVDPLDGTRSFAQGSDHFGVLVALLDGGSPVAGWLHLPALDRSLFAVAGGGVVRRGDALGDERPRTSTRLRGRVHARFMPQELRERMLTRANDDVAVVLQHGCAAVEYWRLACGEIDFVVYNRLLPWDHAAGTLTVTEAGGACRHPDGRPFRPAARESLMLVAREASRWDEARALVFG